jgi:hypothetical protein
MAYGHIEFGKMDAGRTGQQKYQARDLSAALGCNFPLLSLEGGRHWGAAYPYI